MVNDEHARKAIRQLEQRLEAIADQSSALAYALARRDSKEYAQLLKAAEIAEDTVIRPLAEHEEGTRKVYAALDDPTPDWAKVVHTTLDQDIVCFRANEALARARLLQTPDEHFDARMKTEIQQQGE
jgi:hypothetical protein